MELALGVDDVIHLTAVHPAVFGRLDLPAAAHDAGRFLAGPGAVLLTQSDAGTDQFVSGVAADSARSVEDAVAHVFEKVAAFGRFQFGTGQQLTRRSFDVLITITSRFANKFSLTNKLVHHRGLASFAALECSEPLFRP